MSAYTVSTRPQTFDTADGGTVHVTRVGLEIEFVHRTASGRTAATVRMSEDDAADLLRQLRYFRLGR